MYEKRLFWMRFLMSVILTASISLAFAGQKENPWPDFYGQAPTIEVKDPMSALVGSLPEWQTLTLHLTDVALYTGHVCPGIASGYMLTKKALKALYPNSTPERGQICVAAMAPSDLLDVASYITGARAFYGRDEINAFDLAIDPTLKPKRPGKFVMVFQRKDNGKAVKAVFNKFKLMPKGKAKGIKAFLQKMLQGKVSKKEKEQKWAKIQSMVKRILLNTPEGVFNVSQLKEYFFPVKTKKH